MHKAVARAIHPDVSTGGRRNARGRLASAGIAVLALLAGCAQVRPYVPPSEGHIVARPKPEIEAVIPPPARVSSFVPPPAPTIKPQTYSVVVNEVPVKELLN